MARFSRSMQAPFNSEFVRLLLRTHHTHVKRVSRQQTPGRKCRGLRLAPSCPLCRICALWSEMAVAARDLQLDVSNALICVLHNTAQLSSARKGDKHTPCTYLLLTKNEGLADHGLTNTGLFETVEPFKCLIVKQRIICIILSTYANILKVFQYVSSV